MISPSARLFPLVMALFSLTACGTLLDNPTDNLKLAQSGAASPGSQPCNSGAGGASAGSNAGGSNPVGGSAGKGGSGGSTAGTAGSNPVGGSGGQGGAGAGGSAGVAGSGGSDAGSGGSDAGSGGEGGAAGQGGIAGSAGAGGAAGDAGAGGVAGDGGAGGQGGVAGSAGAGGIAGSAGSGGEAGSGGAAAGSGGAAGDGGAAGNAGVGGGVVDSPYEIVTSQDFSPFQDAPPTGFEGGLTAVQVGKGEEDFRLYTRDAQQNVQVTRSTEGSWTPGWTPIPGVQTSAEVAVTTDAFGVTHLLALQGQQIVDVQQQKKGVWSPGVPVGDAQATSGPAVVGSEGGKIEVFVRGPAGDLLHATVAGASSTAWSSLGGSLAPGSAPAAVNDGVGIHVFVRWQDDSLGYRSFTASGGWGPWESWAGALSSGPAVASWGPGRLDVFARGQGGTLLYRSRREDGSLSAAWIDLLEPLDGAPAAVSFGLAQLQVLLKTPQGGVRTAVLLP